MLQWLYDTVNWIIGRVNDTYNWVVSFINNPYGTLRGLLDWLYDRAVYYVNVVKDEIANWTYKLFQDVMRWISYFDNLYNKVIAPAIANIGQITGNFVGYVTDLINNAVQNVANWIGTQIAGVLRFAIDVYNFAVSKTNEIINWVYPLFSGIWGRLSWLENNISRFDPTDLYNKIGELYRFVYNFDTAIAHAVFDKLFDWLADKIGEALE